MANTVYGPASEKQKMFLQSKADIIVYGGGAGCGKALRHGEKVLTTFGWKNIEDMVIGDEVLTPKNTIEKVVGVYPQGEVDIYSFQFKDGDSVEVCGNHLWEYSTHNKLGKLPSKVSTTLEIKNILDVGGTVSIPITNPVDFRSNYNLPMKPYTLGAMLGDGCLSVDTPSLTAKELEIVENIRNEGYTLNKWTSKYVYGFVGSKKTFQQLGLHGKGSYDKFIPEVYLKSSIEDRYSLLRGIMDTDGFVDSRGYVSFNTISPSLAKDVKYVLNSLGYVVTLTIKKTHYKDSDGNRVHCTDCFNLYIKGENLGKLFSIKRKVDRCVDRISTRYVESIDFVGRDQATCISITGEDKLFLTTNFVVTHNSHCALLKALGQINDPHFRAVFIRQTRTQLTQSGGLWDEAKQMYKPFRPRPHEQKLSMTFPSGAVISYAPCDRPEDRYNFDGGQYSLVVFDEAQHQHEVSVLYLMSRLRSKAASSSQLIMTCNPLYNSFLRNWIEWHLDPETGVPIPERDGVVRYFTNDGGKPVFALTKEEMFKRVPHIKDEHILTFTFISANIKL